MYVKSRDTSALGFINIGHGRIRGRERCEGRTDPTSDPFMRPRHIPQKTRQTAEWLNQFRVGQKNNRESNPQKKPPGKKPHFQKKTKKERKRKSDVLRKVESSDGLCFQCPLSGSLSFKEQSAPNTNLFTEMGFSLFGLRRPAREQSKGPTSVNIPPTSQWPQTN